MKPRTSGKAGSALKNDAGTSRLSPVFAVFGYSFSYASLSSLMPPSSLDRLNEPSLHRYRNGMGSVICTQLAQDAAHMCFNCALGYLQVVRNDFV